MNQATLDRYWKRRAASLARRFNLGWWLERFNALALVGLLAFALALLSVRTWWPDRVSPAVFGAALAGLCAALALAAWWIAGRRFVGVEEGLVRLDDRLGLHNRLVSAARDVGPWPEPPALERDPAQYPWNPGRAVLPALAAAALVAAAWWVPIPRSVPAPKHIVEPGAWEQMEDWIATLEAEELLEKESIDELASQVEELRTRPEEEWFSHSSLEATDSLHETLGNQIRDLAEEMGRAERDLSMLRNFSAQMGEAGKQQLAKDYQNALDALAGNGLGMNRDLMEQLKGIDPSKLGENTLGNLSAEQLQVLQDQLRKGSGALGSMEGLPELGSQDLSEALSGMAKGTGEAPGKGGISRGRGDAPLFFGEQGDDLGTSKVEQVGNEDLSRATVGEVLGLGETEREIEKTAAGPVAGGEAASPGRGGDTVSRQSLLPDEQAVLKRYFK